MLEGLAFQHWPVSVVSVVSPVPTRRRFTNQSLWGLATVETKTCARLLPSPGACLTTLPPPHRRHARQSQPSHTPSIWGQSRPFKRALRPGHATAYCVLHLPRRQRARQRRAPSLRAPHILRRALLDTNHGTPASELGQALTVGGRWTSSSSPNHVLSPWEGTTSTSDGCHHDRIDAHHAKPFPSSLTHNSTDTSKQPAPLVTMIRTASLAAALLLAAALPVLDAQKVRNPPPFVGPCSYDPRP
jgi:hypothetical protein